MNYNGSAIKRRKLQCEELLGLDLGWLLKNKRNVHGGLQETSIFKWMAQEKKKKARFGNVGVISFLHKNMCTQIYWETETLVPRLQFKRLQFIFLCKPKEI